MLIVFGGLPGVGKSTIARELASATRAVHIRIDSIEQAIRNTVDLVSMDDIGYRVGYAVAADNLRLGRNVIADSVNPLPVTRDAWLAVADAAGVPALEVEIVCLDQGEHRRRLEQRDIDVPGLTQPTWHDVERRDYRPWDRAVLVIDTANRTVADCVAEILSRLPGGGVKAAG